MPLPIRDGNQSLTTLSTLIVNSAHVPAHTVVSIGSQAITDIAQAVSGVELGPNTINALENISVTFGSGASVTIGNVVSVTGGLTNAELRASSVTIGGSVQVSNLPATQTVTFTQASVTFGQAVVSASNIGDILSGVGTDNTADTNTKFFKIGGHQDGSNQISHIVHVSAGGAMKVDASDSSVTLGAIQGTVTIGNSVTISNFPATQAVTFGQASVTFGSVTGSVSVLNFPATQTIAGTVTANVVGTRTFVDVNAVTVSGFLAVGGWDAANSQHAPIPLTDGGTGVRIGFDDATGSPLQVVNHPSIPLSATVTIGNSVTIGSLPAISGTVTANGYNYEEGFNEAITIRNDGNDQRYIPIGPSYPSNPSASIPIPIINESGASLSISGTVTVSSLPASTVTVSSLPAISGTVTVGAMPSGSLTTRFGSVTTANTAELTSAVTNSSRKYLLIQNVTTGSNVITVGIGFTPTTTQGIQLTAGAGITFESSYIPTGAVYVLSSVTASNFTILEA